MNIYIDWLIELVIFILAEDCLQLLTNSRILGRVSYWFSILKFESIVSFFWDAPLKRCDFDLVYMEMSRFFNFLIWMFLYWYASNPCFIQFVDWHKQTTIARQLFFFDKGGFPLVLLFAARTGTWTGRIKKGRGFIISE